MGTIYVATDAECALAIDWHGGQGTMLYAVASTGTLSTGTRRPTDWEGAPVTDTEWEAILLRDLCRELADLCDAIPTGNYWHAVAEGFRDVIYVAWAERMRNA